MTPSLDHFHAIRSELDSAVACMNSSSCVLLLAKVHGTPTWCQPSNIQQHNCLWLVENVVLHDAFHLQGQVASAN
jgi:hypothetical protein